MTQFIVGLGIGLVVGGGVVYYFYARLKASIGAVSTAATAAKKAL